MHSLPALYAVWPSPSREISTPEASCSDSATAHAYGVAGSRVVPVTTIGAAPSPRIVSGFSDDCTSMPRHPTRPQAKTRPKVGEAASKSAYWAGTWLGSMA